MQKQRPTAVMRFIPETQLNVFYSDGKIRVYGGSVARFAGMKSRRLAFGFGNENQDRISLLIEADKKYRHENGEGPAPSVSVHLDEMTRVLHLLALNWDTKKYYTVYVLHPVLGTQYEPIEIAANYVLSNMKLIDWDKAKKVFDRLGGYDKCFEMFRPFLHQ